MGACLANNGVNPVTGVRALPEAQVARVLSVMSSCGMYDYSGGWIYSVGMPAKSGVGGGIVAVLPGQVGIAVFSPLLDARGNSCRGIRVCEEISGISICISSTPAAPPRPRSSAPAMTPNWSVPSAAADWRSATCWRDTAPGYVSTNSRAS